MLKTRVIPTLLIKGVGLYKGQKFNNEKYVGDPINTLRIFNEKEVDEIIVLDIEATIKNQPINFELIQDLTSECFMPLGYGGGITSLKDMEKLFYLGIEKVSMNAAIFSNLNLLTEAAKTYGSQSIMASIDVKKGLIGRYAIYSQRGTKKHKGSIVDWVKRIEDSGAGEIMLTSIDKEGTKSGFDSDLISQVSHAVSIPVIASGGAGSLEDFRMAKDAGASAVAAGDIFTFYGKHKAVLIQYPEIKELEVIMGE